MFQEDITVILKFFPFRTWTYWSCCCCCRCCWCFIMIVIMMMMIVMMIIIIILIIIIVLFLKSKVDTLLLCLGFSSFVFNLHPTRPVTFIIPSNFVDHDPALVLNISTVTLNPSLEPSVHYETLAIRCFKNAFFDWQSWLRLEINWLFFLDTLILYILHKLLLPFLQF